MASTCIQRKCCKSKSKSQIHRNMKFLIPDKQIWGWQPLKLLLCGCCSWRQNRLACLEHPRVSVQSPGSCWGRMKGSAAKSPRKCRCGGSHFTRVADVHRPRGGAVDSSETTVRLEKHLRIRLNLAPSEETFGSNNLTACVCVFLCIC